MFADKCVYDVVLVKLTICCVFDLLSDFSFTLFYFLVINYVEVADTILRIVDAIHDFELTELLALPLFGFGHILISSF